MKKLIFPIIASLIILNGCDKIDNPIQDSNAGGNTGTSLKRRIVIEEFTGQLCSQCPGGAAEIDRLVGVYGEQLIPISIHAGAFAEPGNGAPNDFTTPTGTLLNTTFGVSAWPAGVVSRINNGNVYGSSQWEGEMITIKDDSPLADITILTNYNSVTRDVAIQVDTEWLEDGESGVNYKLQVYIIEDHIIAPQVDGATTISNYDHRHVMRGAVNTSWGSVVSVSSIGTTDTQNFNFPIDITWAEANCEVVAFLYKEGPDYEIMQGNIEHVQ